MRFFKFFLCLLMLNSSQTLWALPVVAPAISSPHQIGIVAAVRGNVQIAKPGEAGKIANSGEPVFLGDEITTDHEGNLQILLLDETVFTIGPNSAIVIDKFIYDPATQEGEVKAKVVKGIFRFVTGKIARKNPQQMEVELPSGTIGIRGTIVAGESVGKKSLVVLLGPGEQNNTPHRVGRFILSNEAGGKIQEQIVSKTGFGSLIEGEGTAPTPPFQVPVNDLGRINQSLGPLTNMPSAPSEDSPADHSSPTEQSGQQKAAAGNTVRLEGAIGRILNRVGKESNQAAQRNVSQAVVRVLDGPSSRDQLHAAAQKMGGVFHFSRTANFLSGADAAGSTYTFQLDIDFGARRIGGGNSHVDTSFQNNGQPVFNLPQQPFGVGQENAAFFYPSLPKTGGAGCAGCTASVVIGIDNQGGEIAAQTHYGVVVQNTGGTTIGADAGIASRSPGAST